MTSANVGEWVFAIPLGHMVEVTTKPMNLCGVMHQRVEWNEGRVRKGGVFLTASEMRRNVTMVTTTGRA
jgi:hypothetical protein